MGQNTGEEEQYTPNGNQQRDHRLGGRGLIDAGKGAVRSEIVVQEIRENKNAEGQSQGPAGEKDQFLFHDNHLRCMLKSIIIQNHIMMLLRMSKSGDYKESAL